MPRLHHALGRCLLLLALFALACAQPPRPACAPAAVKGKPVLCIPRETGDFFVVGLAEGHGWERGDWVMLDVVRKGGGSPVAVAMAVVVERYGDLAQVAVLYQREAVSLDGAGARKISKDDRARLGKFVGRLAGIDLARVRIDVGGQDTVVLGDVYQVLSPRDHQPIGRVRVTEVGEQWAYGVPFGIKQEQFQEGLDAVFLKNALKDEATPVSILVVSFDPRDDKNEEESRAGRGLAKDLADALARAAEGSKEMSVRFEGKERVRLGAGDKEGENEARLIGKRYAADIVVWGSTRCDKAACVQPRFTVVDPARMLEQGYKGAEIWVERDKAGFSLKGEAPGDPLALAAAILGSVAYDAERYADASYYLGFALSKDVLRGEDELRDRARLAYSMYVRGQTASTRAQATILVQRAREARAPRWEQFGQGELVRVDILEGMMNDARAGLAGIQVWSTVAHDNGVLSYALGTLADLEKQQGRVEEARKLYAQALDLDRRIGNIQGEAATLHQLGILEVQQGRVEEARKLYAQSLELKRHIGHVKGEAATLSQLADLEAQQGRVEEARKLYAHSLGLKRRVGDVQGEATTLHQLAILEAQQGHVDVARKLYAQSLDLDRHIGDVKSEAATLHQLAGLEAQQGRADDARQLYTQSLNLTRRIGDIQDEAASLHGLAVVEAQQGRVEEARKLYTQSLDLTRRVGNVENEASTLHQLAGLEAQQGRMDEARKLFAQSLDLERRIGNVKGEATTLHQLAVLEEEQGRADEARKLYAQSLDLDRRVGYVQGEAATLHQLAGLEMKQGRVDEARKLYAQSLEFKRRIGDVEGEIVSTMNLAVLDYQQGKKETTTKTLEQGLVKARALQHVEYQAEILNLLAQVAFDQNDFSGARQRWTESLALYRQIQITTRIGETTQHLAVLAELEGATASWKIHAPLLAKGGIVITGVQPDGQAAKAALQPGDILIHYDQTRLDKPATLQSIAKSTDPSKPVTLEYLRGAQKLTARIHGGPLGISIADLPPDPSAPPPTHP